MFRQVRANRQKALELAAEKGWVVRQVQTGGQVVLLEGVDENGQPIYAATEFNVYAAATTGTNQLWPGGSSGLGLSGSSAFMTGKLAIWDGGSVLETHQEMQGRIELNNLDAGTSHHATHVAGTMIAAGVNALARGMAFGAPDLRSWDFGNDSEEMGEAAAGLLVSNHSYGRIAGWRFNGDRAGTPSNPNWEWHGDVNVSTTHDYKFGYYDQKSQLWDMIAYHAPHYLIVKSSGNNRNNNGPDAGQPYWRRDSSGNWELMSSRSTMLSSDDGYNVIPTYGNAKNILSVGAVSAIKEGYRKPEDVVMSAFSSWGPTDDGRIKPDLVANGVNLYSSASAGDAHYSSSSGTSMSAPNTSGSLFLLQEHYQQINGEFMLSSTLRGLACHTADDAGNPGPDYAYGWGLLNVARAAEVISGNGSSSLVEEVSLESGNTVVRTVVASGKEPLVVSICWTDPEATPLPINASVLNNRSPRLINDLDVRVSDGKNTFMPWVLDVANPAAPATRGDNTADNIEQVFIADPIPGQTYTITISHKNFQLVRGPQWFSLIATGIGGEPLCQSGATDPANARIDGFSLHGIDQHTGTGCHTYRKFPDSRASLQAGASYPFTANIGSCGQENPRILKVFADWYADGQFDEEEPAVVSEVFYTSGEFSGMLHVPGDVAPASVGTLRLVLVETEDPAEVTACGTYAYGETQDYYMVFEMASTDVGPVAIYSPGPGDCADEQHFLVFGLENFGKQEVFDIPLQARIYENGQLVKEIEEVIPGPLPALSVSTHQFEQSFQTLAGTEVSIVLTSLLQGDVNKANDTTVVSFQIPEEGPDPEAEAVHCIGSPRVTLRAGANGLTYWYDQAVDGGLLAAGNQASVDYVHENASLYAGVYNFSGRLGPESKEEAPWTDGTYARATAHPIIRTHVPLVIESARLYVGYPGSLTFTVVNYETGEVVSKAHLQLQASRRPASPQNGAPDDPDDQGRVYRLNLHIPDPGLYRLRVAYGPGTTLFRATSNFENPYPYSSPGAIDILETTATNSTDFYYWLYDIRLGASGCAGPLVEVPAETRESPIVNLEEWSYLDEGQLILDARNPESAHLWNTGATSSSIAPQVPGFYSVLVTNQWGCQTFSTITITETSTGLPPERPARIYPNPASDVIHVEMPGRAQLEIFTQSGQRLYRNDHHDERTSIALGAFSKGVYILRITDQETSKSSSFRILIQ